ncbi:MAG: hypothetical protein R2695_13345 [Acidimicrobiales bacterium]
MADTRTEISEIVTGLGLFGFRDLERALAARPRFIVNVDDAVYDRLDAAFAAGTHDTVFRTAYANGAVFARADDGLRGRPPWLVEWKGPHRPPAYEQIPADLRVDHVYLVSCKYGSNILHNASPWHVFDRALSERTKQSGDWFAEVAPQSFQEFYAEVRSHVRDPALPDRVIDLRPEHRAALKSALKGQWPPALRDDWRLVAHEIARASADRLLDGAPSRREREEFLWRVLRLQAAPYFVLGAGLDDEPLRYRVGTPWDFRNRFTLGTFDMWADPAGQPTVRWRADLADRRGGGKVVEGHVEVRWSHGKFAGVPEAKIYLDTPHHDVAGYEPLDAGT